MFVCIPHFKCLFFYQTHFYIVAVEPKLIFLVIPIVSRPVFGIT